MVFTACGHLKDLLVVELDAGDDLLIKFLKHVKPQESKMGLYMVRLEGFRRLLYIPQLPSAWKTAG